MDKKRMLQIAAATVVAMVMLLCAFPQAAMAADAQTGVSGAGYVSVLLNGGGATNVPTTVSSSTADSLNTSTATATNVGNALNTTTITGSTSVINAATTNTITGGTGNTMTATAGTNTINAAAANNIINAATTNAITGGTGNTMTATAGNNAITATAGSNTISANALNQSNTLSATGAGGVNNISARTNNIGDTTLVGAATTNNIGVSSAFATVNNIGTNAAFASTNTIGSTNAAATVNAFGGNSALSVVNNASSLMTAGGAGTSNYSAAVGTTGGATVVMKGSTGTPQAVVNGNGLITMTTGVAPAAQSTAALTLTNGLGNTHGVVVTEGQTTMSGGTHSTSLTLNNYGATFSNSQTGMPVQVHGVADGSGDFDAVNFRQMKDAYAGIAAVSALVAIPSPAAGKKFSVGVGYGYFKEQNAAAVGIKAAVTESIILTGGIGYGRDTTVSAGVGYSW